jgi:hypothetical protein
MSQLVLLSIERATFLALDRAMQQGDAEAAQFFTGLWDAYKEQEFECFLCAGQAPHPPFSLFVPDPEDKAQTKLLVRPLCLPCRDLPRQLKMARVFRLLKKMYKSRHPGKVLAFHFLGKQQVK